MKSEICKTFKEKHKRKVGWLNILNLVNITIAEFIKYDLHDGKNH